MSAASGSPSHEAPEASTSTQERSTRSPAAKSDRLALSPVPSTRKPGAAQWTVDKSAPPSTSAGGEDIKRPPPIDDYSDQSSNDSDEDSDELDDGGDDHDRDRELSDGARAGVREDLTDKELVYVLEVIQQPQRARACGFGDKDRRPLSPPPIIQLRIFDKMGKAISPHSVNFHRFVLMVDLWNGDQSQQRSIVMHPGARQDQCPRSLADRQVLQGCHQSAGQAQNGQCMPFVPRVTLLHHILTPTAMPLSTADLRHHMSRDGLQQGLSKVAEQGPSPLISLPRRPQLGILCHQKDTTKADRARHRRGILPSLSRWAAADHHILLTTVPEAGPRKPHTWNTA
ncbi:hypothetical protein Q8F55_003525 [Vanrija albida]|uniref:Velvet domain-containing protein n=1 Tax=Vanrija albida TaxID=181172 RepID=A0ABR3Q486_9TREE